MASKSRFTSAEKLTNNSEQYEDILKQKNIKSLVQYKTFKFNNLKNLDSYNLDSIIHSVQPYEKLYQISQKYYDSPEYGWLILYTNKISNELDMTEGTVLRIYFPLNVLLGLLR